MLRDRRGAPSEASRRPAAEPETLDAVSTSVKRTRSLAPAASPPTMPETRPETRPDRAAETPASPGRWLGIETSGLYGSVAAAEVTRDACHVVAYEPLPRDVRSARALAPAIDALLGSLGWSARDLAAVAVAVGPGSFTGLRVGVVTAKTLAYATETAVVGVETLEALADAAPAPEEPGQRLWAVLDAQRREFFSAPFAAGEGAWRRAEPTERRSADGLRSRMKAGDRVTGPVASAVAEGRGGVAIDNVEPRADAVLRVAWRRWLSGAADDVFALAPEYQRLSAAEEKIAKQEQGEP